MPARRPIRLALVALFVCGLAPPAFADGSLGWYHTLGHLVIAVLVLFGLGIVVVIAAAFYATRKRYASERMKEAEPSGLPEARAMDKRSR